MAALQSPEEKRGLDLMAAAAKALKRFSLFSATSKYEDAIDLFGKAANFFKMAKRWQSAGEAFVKCAECEMKLKSHHEAAAHFVEAAKMYSRVDPAEAISHYRQAIVMFCEIGRFTSAARHAEDIAALYETDNNVEEALSYFQQAADYYSGEDATTKASKCLAKVAQYSATLDKYNEAVQVFERLGTECLDSNLLKFNAKRHFLHAGFCTLARGDLVAMRQALERYSELDYSFQGSREHQLLEKTTDAYENYDLDAFSDTLSVPFAVYRGLRTCDPPPLGVCLRSMRLMPVYFICCDPPTHPKPMPRYSYDKISKLNPWETGVLLKVKQAIEASGEEAVDIR